MPLSISQGETEKSRGTGAPIASITGQSQTIFSKEEIDNFRTVRKVDPQYSQAGLSTSSTKIQDANSVDVSSMSETAYSTPDSGIVSMPRTTVWIPREVMLQEWEGQVQEVGPQYFSARLVDLTNGDVDETEEAELPVSDISDSERDLLVPGATFRWIIGYRYIDGAKERFTRVAIRRLPMWTDAEMKSADQEASEVHNAFLKYSKAGTSEF
jgi:hypothetical protein